MMKTMAEIVYMSADSMISSIAMREGEGETEGRGRDTESVGLGRTCNRYRNSDGFLDGLKTLKLRLRIRIIIMSVVSTVMATERE